MSNDDVKSLAIDVAKDMVAQRELSKLRAFDPTTILVIIQIIQFIIALLTKINPKTVKEQAGKLNLLQRVLIKIKLNAYMKKQDRDIYETYSSMSDPVLKSVLSNLTTTNFAV